jgi:hypothetical protein
VNPVQRLPMDEPENFLFFPQKKQTAYLLQNRQLSLFIASLRIR